MAIKKDQNLENGLSVNDAYIRIDTVSGYKDEITISVNSYVNQESFVDGKPYLQHKLYKFKPNVESNAKELWTQGYEFLKSLEEYNGAEDC